MDFGLSLLAILAIVWLIATPVLLFAHFKLRNRVNELASRISTIEGVAPATAQPDGPWTKPTVPETAKTADEVTAETEDSVDVPDEEPVPAEENLPVPPDPTPASPPRAFVFRRDKLAELTAWLKDHWVLAAGAASLALAGIFLVQYGVEKGLLTPFWRVMAALGFGTALLVSGEVLRRRFGDEDDDLFEFLPSALAGAGILTLFAAVLSARVLYELIGPGPAFIGLFVVSLIAMVFGWFYGPVLTIVGIIGATATPFLVGGRSDTPWLIQYYFVLVALSGLAVDSVKRWAWVSVIVLIATLAGTWLLFLGTGYPEHFIAAVLLIAAAAIIIPERQLIPQNTGAAMTGIVRSLSGGVSYPEFPTRLAIGVTAVAAVQSLVVAEGPNTADGYLSVVAIALLFVATLVWMSKAPALFDLPLFPATALILLTLFQPLQGGALYQYFLASLDRPPETAPAPVVWHILVLATLASLMAFWRMTRPRTPDAQLLDAPVYWALSAAVFAPAIVLILEFLWDPARVYGIYPWALATLAVAAIMTLLAERTARQHQLALRLLCVALFAVAASTMIGLALFLLLTKTALTLSLALMILLIALVDKKFDLPVLGLFALVGIAVISYRLIVDPGIGWATNEGHVPLFEVLLAYLGTMALLGAAWVINRNSRPRTAMVIESAVWTYGAVFLCVMLIRVLPGNGIDNHWGMGLLATIWTTSAIAQLYRMAGADRFELVFRTLLAAIFMLLAILFLSLQMAFFNPLVSFGELVVGPPVFNSLFVAYVPLALALAFGAWRLSHLAFIYRQAFGVAAVFPTIWYLALAIRHYWRGADLRVSGITDPELYSYTLAMLLISAGLLFLAFWKRAIWLRQLAMAGVALTIGKVFLVDMSGLSGLIRVVSFMGLGLALLGLTWLNRVMTAQWEKGSPTTGGEPTGG